MMFETKYRVVPDWFAHWRFQIEIWRWYWPFWTERHGLIRSEAEALALIEMIKRTYK